MRIFSLILILTSLMIAYNNCSETNKQLEQSSTESEPVSGNSCEADLLSQYKSIVYPFLSSRQKCAQCHVDGGSGIGAFGSADINRSFDVFNSVGLTKISYMATNPQHKPPYTGSQNNAAIDQINNLWPQANETYLECMSRAESGGESESIQTSSKSAIAIYTNRNTATLTWELDSISDLSRSSSRNLPARVSINIRVLYQSFNGLEKAVGYIFSNPSLQLKDSTVQMIVEGLSIHVNGVLLRDQNTFANISKVVVGGQPIVLMSAQANTIYDPVATSDTFAVSLRRAVLTSAADGSNPPPTPILSVTDPNTDSKTYLHVQTAKVSIVRDSGIYRWCLSESATAPTSTEATCNNPNAGPDAINGWNLTRPTSFVFSAANGQKTVYLWVADYSLKINTNPAIARIQLDTVKPDAPTISNVVVTDSQVATLNIANGADVTGWCVHEQNAFLPDPTAAPGLSDSCWTWSLDGTKPDSVGFKGEGSRKVRVYVRDLAGNISNSSNVLIAYNSFGPVTFTQLTGPSGDIKSVFTNHCASCHNSISNPGYQKLRLFNFPAAVEAAKSGAIVSRTNNPLSPMPNINGGLMDKKLREIIRLWTLPEEGEDPLP